MEGPNALIPPSIAHLSLYVGFTRSAAELNLPKQNIWIYDTPDYDAGYLRLLNAERPTIVASLVSCGSARDPDYARRHPGHSGAEVITLVPPSWFEAFQDSRWKHRGEEYEALKAELIAEMLKMLVRELPQVEGSIGHIELATPLSTEHFSGHPGGAIYGLAHTPARLEAGWLRPRTNVPQLYLTGVDASVAGVVGGLMGGALTAGALLGKDSKALAALARKATGNVSQALWQSLLPSAGHCDFVVEA